MSMSFQIVFWNLHGNERALDVAIPLCRSRGADLFIAAEPPALAPGLTRSPTARLGYMPLRPGLSVREVDAYAHAVGLRVRLTPESRDLNIVGVHLPSRLYQHSAEDQRMAAETCRGFVENLERSRRRGGVAHDQTIVIGDFNLIPTRPPWSGSPV